jgi:hypothetical protein
MALFKYSNWLPVLALVLMFYAAPTHAFGAGNIASTSKIEGQNWRHVSDGYVYGMIFRS